MAVIPNISIPEFVRRNTGTGTHKRTIRWDFSTGEVQASPDGKILIYSGQSAVEVGCKCLENRIRKVFATVRGEAVIYPLSYGSDFHMLVGKPPDYVESRIQSMVQETLQSIKLISRIEIRTLEFGRDYVKVDLVVYDTQNNQVLVEDIRLPGVLG